MKVPEWQPRRAPASLRLTQPNPGLAAPPTCFADRSPAVGLKEEEGSWSASLRLRGKPPKRHIRHHLRYRSRNPSLNSCSAEEAAIHRASS